jgi:hypothetical protein
MTMRAEDEQLNVFKMLSCISAMYYHSALAGARVTLNEVRPGGELYFSANSRPQ